MNARTVIAPHGDLDVATVSGFREALRDAVRDGAGPVVVDLSEVDFVDSSGLGAIMEMYERFRHGERDLAIVVPPGSAAAVMLNLAGLGSRLPVVGSRDMAFSEPR
jgi:anti-sigma B factor antagonist